MPHDPAFYQWNHRLAKYFPELPEAQRGWLATASFGIALARCAALSAVVLRLAILLKLAPNTVRQRLRELYQPAAVKAGHRRPEFDHTTCFGPLLRWATAGCTGRRVALALDPTDLAGRFLILTISVLYRGCAIPVAWHVQPIHGTGSWNTHWSRLLGALHQRLGERWEVLVLTDRGLESPALFHAITALGWHPLMRVKAQGKFRPRGWHKGYPMRQFAAMVGRRWKGTGLAYPRGSKLPCTLLACWDAGHDEPWLLLTDLAPGSAEPGWYAWRTWIEHGFKRLKSGGWQLERHRMTEADRVARWFAAVALATLGALEVGGGDSVLDWAGGLSGVAAMGLSLFTLGSCWLQQVLMGGRRAPRGRWHMDPWPIDPRPIDPLQENDFCQTAASLPL